MSVTVIVMISQNSHSVFESSVSLISYLSLVSHCMTAALQLLLLHTMSNNN